MQLGILAFKMTHEWRMNEHVPDEKIMNYSWIEFMNNTWTVLEHEMVPFVESLQTLQGTEFRNCSWTFQCRWAMNSFGGSSGCFPGKSLMSPINHPSGLGVNNVTLSCCAGGWNPSHGITVRGAIHPSKQLVWFSPQKMRSIVNSKSI